MANPKVLKAVSVALAAMAELDSLEQKAALEAIQAAVRAGQPKIDHRNVDFDR